MQRKLFVLFAGLVLLSLMIAPVGVAGAQGLALLAYLPSLYVATRLAV